MYLCSYLGQMILRKSKKVYFYEHITTPMSLITPLATAGSSPKSLPHAHAPQVPLNCISNCVCKNWVI